MSIAQPLCPGWTGRGLVRQPVNVSGLWESRAALHSIITCRGKESTLSCQRRRHSARPFEYYKSFGFPMSISCPTRVHAVTSCAFRAGSTCKEGGSPKVKFVVPLPSSSRMITITQKLGEAPVFRRVRYEVLRTLCACRVDIQPCEDARREQNCLYGQKRGRPLFNIGCVSSSALTSRTGDYEYR